MSTRSPIDQHDFQQLQSAINSLATAMADLKTSCDKNHIKFMAGFASLNSLLPPSTLSPNRSLPCPSTTQSAQNPPPLHLQTFHGSNPSSLDCIFLKVRPKIQQEITPISLFPVVPTTSFIFHFKPSAHHSTTSNLSLPFPIDPDNATSSYVNCCLTETWGSRVVPECVVAHSRLSPYVFATRCSPPSSSTPTCCVSETPSHNRSRHYGFIVPETFSSHTLAFVAFTHTSRPT